MIKAITMTTILAWGIFAHSAAWAADCQLTNEERNLVALIHSHRKQNGLPTVTASPSLTKVAHAHVRDLVANRPDVGQCNTHSWSNQGSWTPVCYTPDHRFVELMHSKPREITGGVYSGKGYEIAYKGTAAAASALDQWRNSSAHNDVLLQRGMFAGYKWQAMGVALANGYALVWFGQETDPAGSCDSVAQPPENREARCKKYADSAVAQQLINTTMACGRSGPSWNAAFNYHYDWCTGVSEPGILSRGREGRNLELSSCLTPSADVGCERYAWDAVKAHEENVWRGCGFSSVRWHADYKVHLDWCESVDNNASFGEHQARRAELAGCR